VVVIGHHLRLGLAKIAPSRRDYATITKKCRESSGRKNGGEAPAGEIIQRLLSRDRGTDVHPSDVRARARANNCPVRAYISARALARRCATISNLLACTLITLIITPLSKADRNTKEVYSTLNYVCIAPSHQSPINFP